MQFKNRKNDGYGNRNQENPGEAGGGGGPCLGSDKEGFSDAGHTPGSWSVYMLVT